MIVSRKFPRLCIAVVLLIALAVGIMPASAAVDDTAPFSVNDQRTYEKDNFMLKYDVNSSFTLPAGWEIIEDYGDFIPGLLHVKIPANITVRDAINYFATIEGVIYAEPNYTYSSGPSETDAKRLYDAYRKDRIHILYNASNPERLDWEVLFEEPHDENSIMFEAVVKVPDAMPFEDALQRCAEMSSIVALTPSGGFMYDSQNSQKNLDLHVSTNIIEIAYFPNSTYRLPWNYSWEPESSYGRYTYHIPDNMTLVEAVAYCNSIDDIRYVGFIPIETVSYDSVYPAHVPTPIASIVVGLVCISIYFSRKGRKGNDK